MVAIKQFLLMCAYLCVSLRTLVAEEEIGSPLRIAQCRAHCVLKFSKELQKQEMCFKEPDCLMCWENCQLLQANFPVWGGICSEAGICFPGCQEACRFHREISPQQQSMPVIRTRGEEVIFVKNNTAFWPRPSQVRGHGGSDPLVYVVMRRLPGRMWRQIIQTLDTTSRVPDDLSSGALLRVLVVDGEGLFTIYSPIAADSSLRSANDIARSSGQVNLNSLLANATESRADDQSPSASGRRRINTEINRNPEDVHNSSEVAEYTWWNVREISLIHQKVLVIAEIGWDAVPTHVLDRPVYFVTWEVDGGGLKGNLFTDSTCVTLSLWPDTVYHIQVELVGHNVATGRAQQSEDLLLDTHRAVAVELETSSSNLAVMSVSEVPASHEIQSNEVSPETRKAIGLRNPNPNLPALLPHKVEMLADQDQFEILVAVGAAFALFFLVLAVLVYASCRHSDVLSYPRATMDIFSLKPSKESTIDGSKFPQDFVPILTMVSEQVSNTEPPRPAPSEWRPCSRQSSKRFGDCRRSRSCSWVSRNSLREADSQLKCSARPTAAVPSWRPNVCDNVVHS